MRQTWVRRVVGIRYTCYELLDIIYYGISSSVVVGGLYHQVTARIPALKREVLRLFISKESAPPPCGESSYKLTLPLSILPNSGSSYLLVVRYTQYFRHELSLPANRVVRHNKLI